MSDDAAPIRYRLRRRQLPWYVFVILAGNTAIALRSGHAPAPWLYAASTVMLGLILALYRVIGVELWPDALVVRRAGSTKTVPWRDVHDIVLVQGNRAVRAVTAQGSWTLPAPMHLAVLAPDREFRAKADTIVRYWAEHRGAEWAPRPDHVTAGA